MDSKYFLFIAGAAVMLAVVVAAYFIFLQPGQSPPTQTPEASPSIQATSTPLVQQQTPSASPLPREKLHILPYSWGTIQAQSCEGAERPRVYFFEDPYSYVTAVSKGENVPVDTFIGFFEGKFAGEVDVFHKISLIHSQNMINAHEAQQSQYLDARYERANVELAAKYFVCADSQAKLSEFKKCFYENVLMGVLSNGTREFLPMNKSELDYCAAQTQADISKLGRCLNTAGIVLALMQQDAAKLTEMTVPTAVIDCKYRGHSAYVADAFCYYYPNTKGC